MNFISYSMNNLIDETPPEDIAFEKTVVCFWCHKKYEVIVEWGKLKIKTLDVKKMKNIPKWAINEGRAKVHDTRCPHCEKKTRGYYCPSVDTKTK
jgi:hypothetical protein